MASRVALQERVPRPGGEVRFGIVGTDGRRSSTYKVWARPTSDDVYLVPRSLGSHVKVSMHASGRWHIRFQPGQYEQLGPPTRTPWLRPDEFSEGWTRAFSVVVPVAVATRGSPDEDVAENVTWVVAPQDDVAGIEFTVLISDPGTPVPGWPGRTTMGTELIGKFTLLGGSMVWVVTHARSDLPQPRAPDGRDVSFNVPGQSREEFLERLSNEPIGRFRVLAMGRDDGRNWWFMESMLVASDDHRLET